MKFKAFGEYVIVSENTLPYESRGFVVATTGKLKSGVILSVVRRPWWEKWLEEGSEIVYYVDRALPFDFDAEPKTVVVNINDIVAFSPKE
jgi:hypothetical protein